MKLFDLILLFMKIYIFKIQIMDIFEYFILILLLLHYSYFNYIFISYNIITSYCYFSLKLTLLLI